MNDEQNNRPDHSDDAEHTLPLRPDDSAERGPEPEAHQPPTPGDQASPYPGPASQAPDSRAPGDQGLGDHSAGQAPQHSGPPSQAPGQQSPYAAPASQAPDQQMSQAGPPSQAPGQPTPPYRGPASQHPQHNPQAGPPQPGQPPREPFAGPAAPGQMGQQQGGSGPSHGGGRPPYAPHPGAPSGPNREPKPRAKLSAGVWPAIAAMSLVIGLVGGGLGGYAVNKWTDDHSDSDNSSQGLSNDDVVTTPPLPSNGTSSDATPVKTGSIAAVAEVLLPSTVQIIADFEGEEGGATGSGFFLDKQGHVVTNNHVVADAADGGKITVVDHEGKRYPATVVGRSPVYDLAVLDVEGLKNVHPASLGSSEDLKVGEQVVAIGSPLGLSSTVTSGIVSALDRPVTTGGDQDSQSFINAIQTDAAINPGNSGGPLVNLSGQVVGVNSAIATTGGSSLGGESGNIGVGFAIPIEQVRVTADQILKDGEARYPVIGATVQSDQNGGGARIQEVVADSPAEDSGLKKGDLITAIDDRPVTDNATLIVAIRSHLPGDMVTLTVDRDGDTKKFDVKLDSKVG